MVYMGPSPGFIGALALGWLAHNGAHNRLVYGTQ